MKVRTSFVSNSSSSSFVINKIDLTEEQIYAIYNHMNSGLDMADTDYWSITENEYQLFGWTVMDNFDMDAFFKMIGVTKVEWDHC